MNINVGILGDPSFVSEFGKKGTESDLTLYNYRKDEDTITFIHPTRYPERLSSLLFVLEQCDLVIMEIREINATLGEIIVAIDSASISKGFLYLTNYLVPDQITPLLRGTTLESFEVTDLPPPELKERLLVNAHESSPEPIEDHTVVPIDHHFNVKGIGPVILGIVRTGTVERHQKLALYPTDREVLVRSIQTHDKDVTTAGIGERVGLALKGIETQDLDRGMVLADRRSGVIAHPTMQLQVTINPYWKTPITNGMVLHLSTLMQMRPGRVSDIAGPIDGEEGRKTITFIIEFDKPFVHHSSYPIFVSYLEGGALRVIGKGIVVEEDR